MNLDIGKVLAIAGATLVVIAAGILLKKTHTKKRGNPKNKAS